MDIKDLWEALHRHEHSDECKNQGSNCTTPADLATMKKLKRMKELSEDISASIWDKHAMLLSAFGMFSDHWLKRWPDKAPHLAYLKNCHEASGIIVLCKDPAIVMETWRNVKKPKECETTIIGDAATLLLKSVAMERYWMLGLQ